MNKRQFEDIEAQEDPTADTEAELEYAVGNELDGEKTEDKGKEKVESVLPPKKRARKEVVYSDTMNMRAAMRQAYDCLNARVNQLIWEMQNQ